MASTSRESPGASVEDKIATPTKKKRKLDEHRAFDLKEQEYLKSYEDMESEVRRILNSVAKKLSKPEHQDNVPNEIKYLIDRCQTLTEKTSLDPIYIGLVGRTGAGKSSLLNALIDRQFFLPVSGKETCTSCVVKVNSNRDKNYEAKIHLLSLQEWKEELKNLVELVKKPEDPEQEEEEDETDIDEAVQKLRALYGRDAETRSYEQLSRAKLPINILPTKYILLKAAEAEELSRKLGPYIRCHKYEEDPEEDEERANTRIWPLIKYVEVMIPKSDVIPEGVVFVDIPGTGDYNKERDKMWKESIYKCSVIWIINDIERAVGDRVHEEVVTESIKAYQGGMCTDIALVITKTDRLDLEEYLRERRNRDKHIETKHDAILERNTSVKEKKARALKKKLQRMLPSDSEILCKSDLVYTVSATEYCRKRSLSKEETEIPKLREYIKNICLKKKKQLVLDNVKEALGIVLLARNFNSTQDTVGLYQQDDLEAFVEEKIKALEEDIEKCFDQLEQPLNVGVHCAKSSRRRAFSRLLTRDTGYQGFHRTLKAVCQKNGVYGSPTFGRIDLNFALTQPIYDKIGAIFENIFRVQKCTKASLKSCLNKFKDVILEICPAEETSTGINENWRKFFIQETNIILSTLEREILMDKVKIYMSLQWSIKNDLHPYYKEAAKIQGRHSCQRMQNLLMEKIEEEMEDGMFERAKEKMTERLQDLNTDIVTKLQTDIPAMLKLALSHWEELTEWLPDLKKAYDEIDQIRKELQEM